MHSRTNMNWIERLWFFVFLFRQTPPVFRWPRPELRHDWHGRGRWRGRLWPRRRPRPPRRRRRLLGRSLFLRNLLQVSTPAEPSQENMHQDRLESVSTSPRNDNFVANLSIEMSALGLNVAYLPSASVVGRSWRLFFDTLKMNMCHDNWALPRLILSEVSKHKAWK